MNRIRNIVFALFAIILTLGLISCSTTSTTNSENSSAKIEQKDVKANIEEDKELDKKNTNTCEIQQGDAENAKVESKEVVVEVENSKEATNQNPTITKKSTTSNSGKKITMNNQPEKKSNEINNSIPSNPTNGTTDLTKQIPPVNTVTITIIGPKDLGVILKKEKITFHEGDTILDILQIVTKEKKIDVEYSGTGSMAYIEGIDNIYEFDYGPKSGWNFKLNGTAINKSSGSVIVKKDDHIEWVYSEDFTEDNE